MLSILTEFYCINREMIQNPKALSPKLCGHLREMLAVPFFECLRIIIFSLLKEIFDVYFVVLERSFIATFSKSRKIIYDNG